MIITKKEDRRVRRAARKAGLRICKARVGQHLNNLGGYQLLDDRNIVFAGVNFTLTPKMVMEICGKESRKVEHMFSCWSTKDGGSHKYLVIYDNGSMVLSDDVNNKDCEFESFDEYLENYQDRLDELPFYDELHNEGYFDKYEAENEAATAFLNAWCQ